MNPIEGLEPFQEPLESLQKLLSSFHDRGVIIGGIAVSILGRPRFTNDIDAVLIISVRDIPLFFQEAKKQGLEARIENAVDFARKNRVALLSHVSSHTNVDISFGILPFETEMIERSAVQKIDENLEIRLPTPEDLIILKAVAHRPKDMEDIRILVDKYPNLDKARIEQWVKSFAEVLENPKFWDDIAGMFK